MSVTRKKKVAKAARTQTLKTQFEASLKEDPARAKAEAALKELEWSLNAPLDSLTTDLRMDLKGVSSALFQLGTLLQKHEPMDADLVHWCSRVIDQKVAFIDSVSKQCRSAIQNAVEAAS